MSRWKVAPRGYCRKAAHVFVEIETVHGITYWRAICGKRAITMDKIQLEPQDGRDCCKRCERTIRAEWRKAA